MRTSSRRLAAPLGAAALTAVLLAAAIPRLAGVTAGAGLAPANHPDVVLDRAVQEEFGMLNPVVWVVAARRGTVWTPEILTTVQGLTRDVFKIRGVMGTEVISIASPNMRELEITETGFRPIYLMAVAPRTPDEVAALRARVESNPNYEGTLVTHDGRAAMVVAELQPDVDPVATAAAVRELRDRYTTDDAIVYAAGAPLMATIAPADLRPAAVTIAGALALGLIAALLALGWSGLARSLLAAGLAVTWSGAALIAANALLLPWSALPLLGAALIATGAALAPPDRRTAVALGIAIAAAGLPLALAGLPVRAAGVAMALSGVLALLAAALVSAVAGAPTADRAAGLPQPRMRAAVRAIAALVALGAALGLIRLHGGFGLAGYGQRYLVGREGADLRALAQYFPPPSALAVRVRGSERFVSDPAVLHAFEAWEEAVRADPAVERAMSIADIVKIVHQGFNDGAAAYFAIPDDGGLIGRYLTLAYSPGFRRFLDRSLSTAAIWVFVRGDSATDLARVRDRLVAAMAAAPVATAEIDRFAGDGAVVLAMADAARRLAIGGLIGIALFAAVLAALASPRAAAWALIAALAGALAGAGALGWRGVPIDLLTLPLLLAGTAAAVVVAALGVLAPSPALPRLGALLAAAALVALACPHAGIVAMGAWLLPPALAALVPLLRGAT